MCITLVLSLGCSFFIMKKVKEHLCKTCGENNPDKFYSNQKVCCKVCRNNRSKKNYKDNKDHINTKHLKYRQDNKESIKERINKYYQDNKDQIKDSRIKYKQVNEEYVREYYRQYRKDNAEYLREQRNKYIRERKIVDPGFKYLANLRRRISQVLKGKLSTTEFLGCNTSELRDHFESLFKEGMTHDNHGEWHMDHIIPLSTVEIDKNGEVIDSEYNRMLFHYTNLQPLWAEDNLKKSNKILQ